ncbi:MAG: undecaprenyldiphospho-muramoylpentapeptide beta-N-acetylglucosaminyltransferase [Clostridia bacterium]|nr:undecaprenyldiphospho-muramoylpentapeptide beta-N-acetylglucosaminyltransferase [Clostridia bacterium]
MRVLMSGGGTGGHINPALAIADTIKQNDPTAEIAFVGTKHGKETELVPRAGYPLHFVEIQGISRSLSPQNIKTAWYILTAPRKAAKLIEQFKPDIVIGTGGYACWPTLAAAAKKGIPTMVHESNAIPGLAVRKLQGQVDRILINFEQTAEKLRAPREKIIRVGNPLRGGFGVETSRSAKCKLGIEHYKYVVICFGGSLGAATLNESAMKFMPVCAAEHPETLYVHAAGVRYYEKMKAEFDAAGLDKYGNIKLLDYIHDMPLWMAAADVVIARAGAMTISELSLMHKACILIPSPNVVDDHQYKNAKVLADKNAAVLIRENDLTGDRYNREILSLLSDDKKRSTLSENIGQFADRDANRLIYEETLRLIKEKGC